MSELVPWEIASSHRWAYSLMMLRAEESRRAGREVSDSMRDRLERWLAELAVDDLVVHYDDTTPDGFQRVARRRGIDMDLIRTVG
ncbi:hypothetical protein [Nocardioides sp.]|uniref:hypothetical protein n=1 Tax=Nocardioides sp. TaxID=35761 RepID=UPI003568188D